MNLLNWESYKDILVEVYSHFHVALCDDTNVVVDVDGGCYGI